MEGKKTTYTHDRACFLDKEGPLLIDDQLGAKAPHADDTGTWAPFGRFAFGPEARFMLFHAEDNTLMGGRWPDATQAPEVLWRARVRIHQGYRLALYPHPSGDMIWVHDSALERAFGARIVDDSEVTLHEVAAIKNPIYLGDTLALQRDDQRVARVTLEDEELEVFDLTALPKLDEGTPITSPGTARGSSIWSRSG